MIIRDHRDAAAAAVESNARRAEPCPGCGMPKGSGLGAHFALCPIDTAERAKAEPERIVCDACWNRRGGGGAPPGDCPECGGRGMVPIGAS